MLRADELTSNKPLQWVGEMGTYLRLSLPGIRAAQRSASPPAPQMFSGPTWTQPTGMLDGSGGSSHGVGGDSTPLLSTGIMCNPSYPSYGSLPSLEEGRRAFDDGDAPFLNTSNVVGGGFDAMGGAGERGLVSAVGVPTKTTTQLPLHHPCSPYVRIFLQDKVIFLIFTWVVAIITWFFKVPWLYGTNEEHNVTLRNYLGALELATFLLSCMWFIAIFQAISSSGARLRKTKYLASRFRHMSSHVLAMQITAGLILIILIECNHVWAYTLPIYKEYFQGLNLVGSPVGFEASIVDVPDNSYSYSYGDTDVPDYSHGSAGPTMWGFLRHLAVFVHEAFRKAFAYGIGSWLYGSLGDTDVGDILYLISGCLVCAFIFSPPDMDSSSSYKDEHSVSSNGVVLGLECDQPAPIPSHPASALHDLWEKYVSSSYDALRCYFPALADTLPPRNPIPVIMGAMGGTRAGSHSDLVGLQLQTILKNGPLASPEVSEP